MVSIRVDEVATESGERVDFTRIFTLVYQIQPSITLVPSLVKPGHRRAPRDGEGKRNSRVQVHCSSVAMLGFLLIKELSYSRTQDSHLSRGVIGSRL